ncbi:uncharacterized protein [Anoplolepis gracilipes]|uniref:uncharacterized protein n=1 Tax=Anoplolepis gracilipes TaxID=354296 RepID=UPI003BA33266
MREIKTNNAAWNSKPQYYMPHHCVTKDSSRTTKLRVAFNASNRGNNGISLNDALMVGLVLQQDLFSILVRFRKFKYALRADIAKKYRQILVRHDQTPLQRIVWRDNPDEELKTYELLTLTYGTAPASFLATKVMEQLVVLEEEQFSIGAMVTRRDFYIDDLLTGSNSFEEALIIRDQTTSLLSKGGFLREWASNNINLLQDLPKESISSTLRELDRNDFSKALGIKWNHITDKFHYSIKMEAHASHTKRSIMSNIA